MSKSNKKERPTPVKSRSVMKDTKIPEKTKSPVSGFFWHLIFLLISVISVFAIRNLPKNKAFEEGRVEKYYEEKARFKLKTDSTFRANLVHEEVGRMMDFIEKYMQDTAEVFLLPSQYFMIEKSYDPKMPNNFFFWLHPSSFKNHSYRRLKFVEANYPDSLAYQADFTLWPVGKGQVGLLSLDTQAKKDSVINTFRKYKQFGIFSAKEAQAYLKSLEK